VRCVEVDVGAVDASETVVDVVDRTVAELGVGLALDPMPLC
jgi:hypothetical protein